MRHTLLIAGLLAVVITALTNTNGRVDAQTAPPAPTSGRIISGSIPSNGGFGLIVYSGGSFDDLVTASGCPASQVAFWFTVGGQFVVFVPGSTVGAVNAGAEAAFPNSTITGTTALIGRCTPSTQLQVTLADDGGTVMLHVGDTFLLNLGESYSWTVQVGDPAVVSRVVNIAVIRGAQGVYRANGQGTTTLTATGSLVCPPGSACPALARLARFTVVVQ